MEFEFATATRIVFGSGRLREIGRIAKGLGDRALIVTGRSPERARRMVEWLSAEGISAAWLALSGEPTVDDVREGARLARTERCSLVIGFGGGSAMDAAKAIAALLTNPGDLFDYLEVVGSAKALPYPSAPCLTVPTTAGTGAEVTRNAVLAAPRERFKVSLRSAHMLPKVALVDPELTVGLPQGLTATTGLDALTQLIEPYVSHRANPMTDGFCLEGLGRVTRALRRAYDQGHDTSAREDMALASLLSGLALANAALGAVHGFAAPLGGMSSGPHGGFCAAILPQAFEVNVRALRQRQPANVALQRYQQVARVLTGNSQAEPEDGLRWVRELCAALKVPSLREYGVQPADFPELIEKASRASSMKGNPIALDPSELQEILDRSL